MAECIIAGRIGPKGDTGDTGATGPQGPQGPAGTATSGTLTISQATVLVGGDYTYGFTFSSSKGGSVTITGFGGSVRVHSGSTLTI